MKQLLILLLLTAAGVSQTTAAEKRPRNKKTPETTQTVTPQATPTPEKTIKTESRPKNQTDARPKRTQPHYKQEELLHNMTPTQVDSLVAEWREQQTLCSFDNFFNNFVAFDPAEATPEAALPDSVYVKRLRDLVSPIQLPYNNIVKGYINRYTDTRYGTINRILSLSQYYFPLIEEELIKAGLPIELRALPIIESALSPTAVSPMGAAGLWQFMPATGKVYGLEVNSLVDERRDPMLATRAACRYLKDLYDIYNDWSLAIAAYNCGPGNVNKAIARSGGTCRSFWDIYDYLPRETRGYVPAFIGASYAYAYHREHGIKFSRPPLPLATDTIQVDKLMHLAQITSTINIPIETLRQLNPQYKLDIIPATTRQYTLILPQRCVSQYIQQRDSIFAKDSLYLKEYINPVNIEKKQQAEYRSTIYTVKKGDTLGTIAKRYRVSTVQLMRWNGIKNANKLSLGQKIRIEGR